MLIGGKSMKVLVTGVNGQLGYDVMNELNQTFSKICSIRYYK